MKLKGLRESLRATFASLEKALDDMALDMERSLPDFPDVEIDTSDLGDGEEKITVTEERRPDGTQVIIKTVVRKMRVSRKEG